MEPLVLQYAHVVVAEMRGIVHPELSKRNAVMSRTDPHAVAHEKPLTRTTVPN
jgi:hypothetical protein